MRRIQQITTDTRHAWLWPEARNPRRNAVLARRGECINALLEACHAIVHSKVLAFRSDHLFTALRHGLAIHARCSIGGSFRVGHARRIPLGLEEPGRSI